MIDNRGLGHTTGMKTDRKQVATIDNDKDNRKESEKHSSKPCPYEQIMTLWHISLSNLPQPKSMTGPRKKHLAARWNSSMKSESGLSSNTVDFWKGLFDYIRKSEFLMGNNDRKWKPNFDWVIQENNFIKILEGNYHK